MMIPTVYLISALILISAAFVIFRIFLRRDYYRRGRLTPFSVFLETLIFFLLGASACIFVPSDWPAVHVGPILSTAGWALIAVGLATMLMAMAGLGLRRYSKQPDGWRRDDNGELCNRADECRQRY